jgi:hypothetical protein
MIKRSKLLIRKKAAVYCLIFGMTVTLSCKKYYEQIDSDIVINELMPVNSTTVTDNYGEYDDWIELYNKSNSTVDISGYYISDSKKKPLKWQIPDNTYIPGNGYLIIWADKDTTEKGLHANFKLSSKGETVSLSNSEKRRIDRVKYPPQKYELTYSRVPDGTGSFRWEYPSFGRENGTK